MTDTVILSSSEESRRGPSARPPASAKASAGGRDDLRGGPSARPQDDLRVGFSPASVLTRAELLDHARHPRNKREMPEAQIIQEEANPLCGDVVTVYAVLRHPERSEGSRPLKDRDPWSPESALERSEEALKADTVLDRVGFTGSGCIISQAAASMLTEAVVGKSPDDVRRMGREDMEQLLGGAVSPARVKCAMLALIALKSGLTRHAHRS